MIDTVYEFLKQYPIQYNSDILAISDQPYILYQDAVLRTVFVKEKNIRTFETVGYATNSDTKISVYLDSVARTLYANYYTH